MKFVFVLHDHQPVGNFDEVFEDAYRRSYLPYLDVAESEEWFRFGLHLSGPLLEWLERRHPEYLDRLAALVKAGRVEMLGGAFYEAVLTMPRDRDRRRQLEMMNDYIESRFGRRPRGMWLAERVWEQSLAADIADAGLEYTLLDDHHFRMAGIPPDKLDGYYTAEDRGRTLAVFPISERLRYLIPFAPPFEAVKYLVGFSGRDSVVVYGDDGEKFGLWPHTWHTVYREGWLKSFLTTLRSYSWAVEVCLPGEALDSAGPRGMAYLPDCSYREMTEWALPVEAHDELIRLEKALGESGLLDTARRFLKGASWRAFRARYPESANMYALQVEVSRGVEEALSEAGDELSGAERALLRGQCDCAYWHGVFGGLYLPHLRDAVYENLIEAQRELVRRGLVSSGRGDYDLDGDEDVRLVSDELVAYLKPRRGGMVRALNVLAARVNLANTLARHRESYHSLLRRARVDDPDAAADHAESIHEMVVAREEGLERFLAYDWHERGLFQEHIVPASLSVEEMKRNAWRDEGDFILERFEVVRFDESGVLLRREGGLWRDGRRRPLVLEKEFRLEGARLSVRYRLENPGSDRLSFRLGVESTFGVSAPDAPDRYYEGEEGKLGRFGLTAALEGRRFVTLCDEWRRFRVRLDWREKASLRLFPIYTVSQSEAGFERVFQGAVVMPLFDVELEPGESRAFSIDLEVSTW